VSGKLPMLQVRNCENYWCAYTSLLFFQKFGRENENFLLPPTCPTSPHPAGCFVDTFGQLRWERNTV